jgi:hypothetical protein
MGRVGKWFRHYSTVLIGVPATALLATAPLAVGHYFSLHGTHSWATVLVVTGVILALWSGLLVVSRQRRLDKLEATIDRAETAEEIPLTVLNDELIQIRTLAHHFTNERASIFRHDNETHEFVLVGRVSLDTPLAWRCGRFRYPEEQGVLGEAWHRSSAHEPGLPDAGTRDQPADEWVEAQMSWGLPRDDSTKLRMRTRCYTAIRIESERSGSAGIVMFESRNSAAQAAETDSRAKHRRLLTVDELKPIVDDAASRLVQMLDATRSIPDERLRRFLDQQRRN